MKEEKSTVIHKEEVTQTKLESLLEDFNKSYFTAAQKGGLSLEECQVLFNQFIELIQQNLKQPHKFGIFNQSIRQPFDYYQFGLNFIAPLIDLKHSQILHKERLDLIVEQIARGENVIFLANHQTEPDPQIFNLMLQKQCPDLVAKMIFVAGHRVVQDPVAIPMSMGCNLLCIYSKKHMDHPPSDKPQKVSHNQRTMVKMSELLSEGGQCIYVAPSGGRDRPNAHGFVDVAPFDPQSIEMFWIMAQRSEKLTHFYPLTLLTYDVLPPPRHVEKELGEKRVTHHSPVFLAFGEEIEMNKFAQASLSKKEKRNKRADFIWNAVHQDYLKLVELKNALAKSFIL